MTISRREWAGLGAVLLAAFALRVFRLDWRALWWDEGLTLFFARLGFVENAAYAVRLADTNPPIYRMLVGAWTAAAGSSAFATRLFSALAGMITVAATARLGRAWLGAGLGLAAGALAAASPLLVYFSQEAKAYSLVAACGAIATLLCLRLSSRPAARRRPSAWLAYGLASAIALGSHYIAAFLIAVQAAWLAFGFWREAAGAPQRTGEESHRAAQAVETPRPKVPVAKRRGRGVSTMSIIYLSATMALVVAAQVPYWLLTFAGTSAVVRGETGEFVGLNGPGEFAATHLLEFGVGPGTKTEGDRGNQSIEGNEGDDRGGAEVGLFWAAAVGLAGLALAGATMPAMPNNKFPYFPPFPHFPFFLLSLVLLPLFAGFLLNSFHEFFFPRFLLYSAPPFLALAAAGLSRLWQGGRAWRAGAAGLAALVVAAWGVYLADYYAGPGEAAQAEDWRPLAAALRPHVQAGDAAVYARGWMPGYLHAYLPPAPEPDYYLAHFTPESLAPELESIAAAHRRVWLLDYQIDQFDARNPAGRWLGEHGALVYAEWFGDGHAALFLAAQGLPDPGAGQARRTEFTNGLQLAWSPVATSLSPGQAFAFGLEWTAPGDSAPARRFTVFLHGLAADGSLAFGRDSEPANGLRPADGWARGERVREWRGALLPPGLPPGEYTLQLGLYDTLSAEAIPARDGAASLTIGRLTVP